MPCVLAQECHVSSPRSGATLGEVSVGPKDLRVEGVWKLG